MSKDGPPRGRPLRLDPAAKSAAPDLPAFLSKPAGAPVYHGFPTLEDVEVDGFRLGMITDWEAKPADVGDAFVVAPDGSRAGLNWEISAQPYVSECAPPEEDRWGVWNVGFTHPMRSRDAARANLREVLPDLRREWLSWRSGERLSRLLVWMAGQDFDDLVATGLLKDVEEIVVAAYISVHPDASRPDAYRRLRYEDPDPVGRLAEGVKDLRRSGAKFDPVAVDKACARASI